MTDQDSQQNKNTVSGDRRVVVERLDYSQMFSFTRIFKSFLMAIDGSRLILALTMVLLLALWGLLLDGVFSLLPTERVLPNELSRYASAKSRWDFKISHEAEIAERRELLKVQLAEVSIDYQGLRDGEVSLDEQDAMTPIEFAEYRRERREPERNMKQERKSIHAQVDERPLTWTYNRLLETNKKVFDRDLKQKEADNKLRREIIQDPGHESNEGLTEEQIQKNVAAFDEQSAREINRFKGKYYSVKRQLDTERPRGVFSVAITSSMSIFTGLMDASARAVLGLDAQAIGIHHIKPGAVVVDPMAQDEGQLRSKTVIGSLRLLTVTFPSWLFYQHQLYFMIYMAVALLIWAIFGGAISRSAALEATRDEKISISEAFVYVKKRIFSYVMAPITPLILLFILSIVLMVYGFVFFNVPGLNVIGALFIWVPFIIAFIMAVIFVLWTPGVHLFYPALSINGGDFFEAIFTSWSFIITRPWRAAIYYLTALVYGAATYLIVGLLVFLTLYFAQRFTGTLVQHVTPVTKTPYFDAMFSPPVSDNLQPTNHAARYELEGDLTYFLSAVIIRLFVYVLIAMLAAYVISYYFSAMTHVFLLLRQRTDGVDYSQVHRDKDTNELFPRKITPPDKVVVATEVIRMNEQQDNHEEQANNKAAEPQETSDDISSPESGDAPDQK